MPADYTFVCGGQDLAVWNFAWPGGTMPTVEITVPGTESGSRDFTAYLSDGPVTNCADFDDFDTLWFSNDIPTMTPGSQTISWTLASGADPQPAGSYVLIVDMTPDGDMTDTEAIGQALYDVLLAVSAEMALPLEWSATLSTAVALTSVTDDTAVDDAWQVGLEWSCLLDLDPPDDVEDP